MKTTIDIPNEELDQLIQFTGAETKKDAVIQAIRSYNKRHKMTELTKMLGTFENFMSSDELENTRKDRI